MNFRFWESGHRAPPLPPPQPPYFAEHAFRGGYPVDEPEMMGGPAWDYYDPIQREIEKEQIRKEIIAEDMARRRMLEAEVRMEMMMEREMAMRADVGLSFEERLTMQLDGRGDFGSRPHHVAFDEGFGFGSRGGGLFDRVLPSPGVSLPRGSGAVGAGVTGASESDKNKLIVLPKPEPKLSGEKRKAETSLSTVACDLSSLLRKKPKEEWSCALCQVTATSEQGLNEHLKGKKHKNNEAKLRAQNMSKNSNKLSKKTAHVTKPRHTSAFIGKGAGPNLNGESIQPDESGNGSLHKVEIANISSDGKQPTQEDQDEKASKEMNSMAMDEKQDKTTQPLYKKKKFKFWCEMCKVGAFSATVMASHKMGKKHMSLLEEAKQGKVAFPAAKTTGSLTITEKPIVPDATALNLVAFIKKESAASMPEAMTANLEVIKREYDADILAQEDVKTTSTVAAE